MPGHKPWNPDPAPFGNARGLDYVSLDVKARIAHRFGATVMVGHLPDDIAVEQPERLAAAKRAYGDRHTDYGPDDAFACFTISWDGATFSGEHADGKGHTSGYRSHYWLDRIGPETIVFDLRTVPGDDIVKFAVRGPMLDVTLPPGSVSALDADIVDDHFANQIADAYLQTDDSLTKLGY